MQLDGSLGHARELTLNIAFRTGDSKLTAEDIDQLTTLGQLAGGMAGVKIQVSGHADPRGSSDYNTALSKERAESVAAVLTNAGLSQDHIVIEALGATAPLRRGSGCYAFQRRVSVKLLTAAGDGETKPSSTTVAQAQ